MFVVPIYEFWGLWLTVLQRFDELILADRELARGEPFPPEYYDAFTALWSDEGVQLAVSRGNEFALHDNLF